MLPDSGEIRFTRLLVDGEPAAELAQWSALMQRLGQAIPASANPELRQALLAEVLRRLRVAERAS